MKTNSYALFYAHFIEVFALRLPLEPHFLFRTLSYSTVMDKSTVKCIKRVVRINALLGYLPYGWSDKSDTVKFDNSPWKRACFYFQVVLYWSFIALMAIRSMYVTYVNRKGMTVSSRTNLQFTAVE